MPQAVGDGIAERFRTGETGRWRQHQPIMREAIGGIRMLDRD